MGLVRAVLACVVFGLTTGQSPDSVRYEALGETVLLNSTLDPFPYTYLSWREKRDNITIITISSNGLDNYTNPEYANKITLFPDGSLELRNLTMKDSGHYTLNINVTEGPQIDMLFYLYVLDPITDVTLSASATDLIEDQSSVNLTCSTASQSDWSYSWLNGSFSFAADSPVVTLTNVSRYDTGPFRCRVRNFISYAISEEVHLTINYGPDVDMKVVPIRDVFYIGFDITLFCRVKSNPRPEITWFFRGNQLPVTGLSVVLEDLSKKHDGDYHCEAFNNITMLRQTSPPFPITVVKFPSQEQGISDGAIAGICIAALTVGLGVTACECYSIKKKSRERAMMSSENIIVDNYEIKPIE